MTLISFSRSHGTLKPNFDRKKLVCTLSLNQWLEFDQTSTDTSIGWGKKGLDFGDLDLIFKVTTLYNEGCVQWEGGYLISIAYYRFMSPTSKKLREHIGFGLSVHSSVRSSKTVHARVLNFHIIWIPHGKIVDAPFFSCLSCLPFWSYAPLKKPERNLMHAISYEPCMLGFWNFIYGFLMEKQLTRIFFLVRVISLSGVIPLWKNLNEILSAR